MKEIILTGVTPTGMPHLGNYIGAFAQAIALQNRSEEHTSELQSLRHLVCRLLLEKKKMKPATVGNENVHVCNNGSVGMLVIENDVYKREVYDYCYGDDLGSDPVQRAGLQRCCRWL